MNVGTAVKYYIVRPSKYTYALLFVNSIILSLILIQTQIFL